MTNHESSDNSFDDIDNELHVLLSGESVSKFGNNIVESLSSERDELIECLASHLAAGDTGAVRNRDAIEALQEQLSTLISIDFDNRPRLRMGDEISASGDTMFILVESDGDRILNHALNLSNDECVRGLVSDILVHDIPPLQIYDRNKREDEDDEGRRAPDDATAIYPFGLSLVLTGVVHEDTRGHSEDIPDRLEVRIPLNYPSLKLNRIIKQEAN